MTEPVLVLEWYVAIMREELKHRLKDGEFIGNISFEFNIKQGGIVNMNLGGVRSFRHEKK